MGKLGQFFDFTTGQIRFLVILCATALLMGLYLLIHSYATPTTEAVSLPVFLADQDSRVTGMFVLDPNTAPADSLELLPGIGTVIADRVVEYRQHRYFEREVDITEVKGIGPKLYERIRPYLKVKRQ
jgi:predicted flap endonuclease-1-like 5' DNA nuclease